MPKATVLAGATATQDSFPSFGRSSERFGWLDGDCSGLGAGAWQQAVPQQLLATSTWQQLAADGQMPGIALIADIVRLPAMILAVSNGTSANRDVE